MPIGQIVSLELSRRQVCFSIVNLLFLYVHEELGVVRACIIRMKNTREYIDCGLDGSEKRGTYGPDERPRGRPARC